MSTAALLEVEGLNAGYGKSQVLFGMALRVDAGTCSTLLGRNGMGKTTTIKSIMGLIGPTGGAVRWCGRDVRGRAPHAIARLGLGLVPEGRQIFPTLTVKENLIATARQSEFCTGSRAWTLERVYGMFPRLEQRQENLGWQLSGGEQQMLAIGRALMTNPRVLVLDEATEGLAPLIREDIWTALRALKSEGMAQIVIDKNLDDVAKFADTHYVIEKGKVVWTGSSAELDQQKDRIEEMVGI